MSGPPARKLHQTNSSLQRLKPFKETIVVLTVDAVVGGLGGDDAAPVAASVVAEARPKRVVLPADLHVHEPPLRPTSTLAA